MVTSHAPFDRYVDTPLLDASARLLAIAYRRLWLRPELTPCLFLAGETASCFFLGRIFLMHGSDVFHGVVAGIFALSGLMHMSEILYRGRLFVGSYDIRAYRFAVALADTHFELSRWDRAERLLVCFILSVVCLVGTVGPRYQTVSILLNLMLWSLTIRTYLKAASPPTPTSGGDAALPQANTA